MSAQRQQTPKVQIAGLLVLPVVLFLTIFFIVPFGIMVVGSIFKFDPATDAIASTSLHNYKLLTSDIHNLEAIANSVRIALWTTGVAVLIGYPVAHMLVRIRSPFRRLLLIMAVMMPLLTGVMVRTFAWMTILSDTGIINKTLIAFGMISAPLPLMYNDFGIIIGLTHILAPFMILILASVIQTIDVDLERAAVSLGATPFRAFWEVTLPLSLHGVIAGSALVFSLAISSYVTPVLLGGYQVTTLPMLIYQQVSATFNLGYATALGVALLLVSLGLMTAYLRAFSPLKKRW